MKMSFIVALERYKKLEAKKEEIVSYIIKYNLDSEYLMELSNQLKEIDKKIKEIEISEVDASFLF